LKRPVAVAWRRDLDGPDVGLDRLAATAVADIAALRLAARRVPEVPRHLGLQRRLHDPAGQLRQPPARPRQLLGLQAANGVIKRALGQQLGEAVDDLLGRLLAARASALLGAPQVLHGTHGDRWIPSAGRPPWPPEPLAPSGLPSQAATA